MDQLAGKIGDHQPIKMMLKLYGNRVMLGLLSMEEYITRRVRVGNIELNHLISMLSGLLVGRNINLGNEKLYKY